MSEKESFPLEASFLLALFGMAATCALALLQYFLRSRCEDITCCYGLVTCRRNVLPADVVQEMDATRRDGQVVGSTNLRLQNVSVVPP